VATTDVVTESTTGVMPTTAPVDSMAPAWTGPPLPPGTDPADQYLPNTEVIYQRTMPDGTEVVVRRSLGTYADTFGYRWTAPTGDGSCLGDHALLIGTPGRSYPWGSAWTATQWFDAVATPSSIGSLYTSNDGSSGLAVVRVDGPAGTLRINSSQADDEAPVVNGVAVIRHNAFWWQNGPVPGTIVDPSGATSTVLIEPSPLWPDRPECGPGPAPAQPMPKAGRQPADPNAGDAVRALVAKVGDQSVPWEQKEALFDDVTGVKAAIDTARSGQFAVQAKSAVYSADELVFTSPTEAWLRYTITTDAGTYSGRIGRAVLKDGSWRITRATICADLAFATSPCSPAPEPMQLPPDPAWEKANSEWMARAMLYNTGDGCPPLSGC
jgi:hypothetical protein